MQFFIKLFERYLKGGKTYQREYSMGSSLLKSTLCPLRPFRSHSRCLPKLADDNGRFIPWSLSPLLRVCLMQWMHLPFLILFLFFFFLAPLTSPRRLSFSLSAHSSVFLAGASFFALFFSQLDTVFLGNYIIDFRSSDDCLDTGDSQISICGPQLSLEADTHTSNCLAGKSKRHPKPDMFETEPINLYQTSLSSCYHAQQMAEHPPSQNHPWLLLPASLKSIHQVPFRCRPLTSVFSPLLSTRMPGFCNHLFFSLPALVRLNLQTTMCKFQVYNVILWHTYIAKWLAQWSKITHSLPHVAWGNTCSNRLLCLHPRSNRNDCSKIKQSDNLNILRWLFISPRAKPRLPT